MGTISDGRALNLWTRWVGAQSPHEFEEAVHGYGSDLFAAISAYVDEIRDREDDQEKRATQGECEEAKTAILLLVQSARGLHHDDLMATTPAVVGCDSCGLCTFRLGYHHCRTRYRPVAGPIDAPHGCRNFAPIRDDLPRPEIPGPPEDPAPSATMDRIEACNLHLGKVEERLTAMARGGWRRMDPSVYEAIDELRTAVSILMIEVREIREARK